MSRYISYRDFDWTLLGFILLICSLGVLEIYSTTFNTKFEGAHIKQIYWIIAGLVLMFVLSVVNYHTLLDNVHWMYLVALASLVGVMAFGRTYLGAKRWVSIAGIHFQPSEWIKLIVIIAIAKYFAEDRSNEVRLSDIVKISALVGIPFLMVLRQPDMGTALTYTPVAIMGLFLGGIKARHIAIILLCLVPTTYIGVTKVLKPYQRDRLMVFMNPEADPQKKGYQVMQSKVAVGSGGLMGKGITKGSQTQGSFLPIPQTDFIFAAFCEEHGFVGAIFLLLLYFIVLMRLIHNAQTAPDRAGTFIVMGLVSILAFHVLVNVGMVVGFMPVTGIPLPFMSYGGSSVLFMFLALGIVMNVRMRRFVN